MTKHRHPPKPRKLTIFDKLLKNALKNFHKPHILGEKSPLATPYFLGRSLTKNPNTDTPSARGEILCNEIYAAATTLWHGPWPDNRAEMQQAIQVIRRGLKDERYSYLLLELKHFHQYINPGTTKAIYEKDDLLPTGKATFFVDYDNAVRDLGQALLKRVRPTLRLEDPPVRSGSVGYEEVTQQCMRELYLGKTVAISGPGGVGKSTLGAEIAQRIESSFWFTFRPTLNDQLHSLLFALGHFLQQLGTSHLWQLLLAEQGAGNDLNLALGMVYLDLENLTPRPLLCFDELDRLQARNVHISLQAHNQLLEFIEALRGHAPLLLIGQQAIIEADYHQELSGLATPHIEELLCQANIDYTREAAERLFNYTGGNPRLLTLCIAAAEPDEAMTQTIDRLPKAVALQPLLYRMWSRLEASTRYLLQTLSVFRSPSPIDAWPTDEIEWLLKRRLLLRDGLGGIWVVPALRELIYAELPAEQRETHHLLAAEVRLARAEYTAAAYHYWQGNEENRAVQVWYPHLDTEIQRGQASAAYLIFLGISRRRLRKPERSALDLIRAQLHRLNGDATNGLFVLEAGDWSKPSRMNLQASTLRGQFYSCLGYPDKALTSYADGIDTVIHLLRDLLPFHHQRGIVYVQQREHAKVWSEVRLAEWTIHNLRGLAHDMEGHYAESYTAYRSALTLAELLEDDFRIAQTYCSLAILFGRQQDLYKAETYATAAIEYFERTGDRLNAEQVRGNILSGIYLQVKQYQKAIDAASQALPFFQKIQDPHRFATTAHNLSEAYFELGNFDQAERYANAVLEQEDRFTYPYAHYTLGQIKRKQQAWVAAEVHFIESVNQAQINRDLFLEAYAQRGIGCLYLDWEKKEAAIQTLQEALRLFKQLDIVAEIGETTTLLEKELCTTKKANMKQQIVISSEQRHIVKKPILSKL